MRKNLLDYDNVMNMQRNAIYGMRRKALEGLDIERTVLDMLGDVTSIILDTHTPENGKREQWSLDGLNNALYQQFGFKLDFQKTAENSEAITNAVKEIVKANYDKQKSTMGPYAEQIMKMVLLQSIDLRWKEHLYVIDKLKEGIGLRGYSGKDPLIEYKKEAFNAFENLSNIIKADVVEKIMRVQIVAQQAENALESFRPQGADLDGLDYQSPSELDAGGGFAQAARAPAETAAPQKRKMTMSRGEPADDLKMNRADRRRLEKRGKK
jgi:preprotein translocase subunit SecA